LWLLSPFRICRLLPSLPVGDRDVLGQTLPSLPSRMWNRGVFTSHELQSCFLCVASHTGLIWCMKFPCILLLLLPSVSLHLWHKIWLRQCL
jgi:hypothetical protein